LIVAAKHFVLWWILCDLGPKKSSFWGVYAFETLPCAYLFHDQQTDTRESR